MIDGFVLDVGASEEKATSVVDEMIGFDDVKLLVIFCKIVDDKVDVESAAVRFEDVIDGCVKTVVVVVAVDADWVGGTGTFSPLHFTVRVAVGSKMIT